MPTSRLAHAFVFVSDLERVAAFYTGAFGMRREQSSEPGFVMMRATSGADIAIHSLPPHIAAEISVNPPSWRDQTAYKICFETDDVDAQRAAILAHGGLAKEPWSWEGTDFCECTDPEGNVVQIFRRAE
jgi:predicted enzyme related to lactoylglutathione lyase